MHPTTFRDCFKRFKSVNIDECSDVLQVDDKNIPLNVSKIDSPTDKFSKFPGLRECSQWNIYTLNAHPGLILIKNPFTCLGQRYWMYQCINDYPQKHNKRNIDIDNQLKQISNLWRYSIDANNSQLFDKLRWATLGFHHNWDTKVYDETCKSDFPKDLADLIQYFAESLKIDFVAQAAIVNYYHKGSTLAGHTDHSELDLKVPLFSISFGQPAIFLIGGKTLMDKPSALLLESGDVVVMSKESRLCYHGVPRIFNVNDSSWWNNVENHETYEKCSNFNNEVLKNVSDETFWAPFNMYVTKSRININIRQVFKLMKN